MNLLLDTHTFIWFVEGSPELSQTVRQHIEKPQNQGFVSMASLWEMSIKVGLDKLDLKSPFDEIMDDIAENGFELLPVFFRHLSQNARKHPANHVFLEPRTPQSFAQKSDDKKEATGGNLVFRVKLESPGFRVNARFNPVKFDRATSKKRIQSTDRRQPRFSSQIGIARFPDKRPV